jgi:hypothetical protein
VLLILLEQAAKFPKYETLRYRLAAVGTGELVLHKRAKHENADSEMATG